MVSVLVEVDDVPGEGELLTMRSVGICSSDLLYLRVGTERVLGHELAGVRADGTAVAVEASTAAAPASTASTAGSTSARSPPSGRSA